MENQWGGDEGPCEAVLCVREGERNANMVGGEEEEKEATLHFGKMSSSSFSFFLPLSLSAPHSKSSREPSSHEVASSSVVVISGETEESVCQSASQSAHLEASSLKKMHFFSQNFLRMQRGCVGG